ncbi:Copia protein [Phytophthora megakarya]|uniref:Copia protein n=1 Tax=Phytophthora megakarya TaxID=4795 RepID=A0A225WC84_9STRA|nr:Copia protein [Phytophthora megakarya]
MCVYFRHRGGVQVVVGAYVDDLLVTATEESAVDAFFDELAAFSVKHLGRAMKFLGMRVKYDDGTGYDLDQETTIQELMKDHGLENAHGVRTPVGVECNEAQDPGCEKLPVSGGDTVPMIRKFQSLVGCLLWSLDARDQT